MCQDVHQWKVCKPIWADVQMFSTPLRIQALYICHILAIHMEGSETYEGGRIEVTLQRADPQLV